MCLLKLFRKLCLREHLRATNDRLLTALVVLIILCETLVRNVLCKLRARYRN